MNEAEDILIGISEAHSSADTALEIWCGTWKVECYHALILVPDVYHSVYLVIRCVNIDNAEKSVPSCLEFFKTCGYLFRSVILLDHCESLFLIDSNAVSLELLVNRHFNIAEDKYKSLWLARSKCYLLVVWSDRWPAVCKWVVSLACFNSLWVMEAVIKTDKWISVCIIAVYLVIYCIECKVISSVSVFCLVIDSWAYYLNTACAEVSLEVCAVVLSVPKTPLCKWEEWECFFFIALVCENYLLNFAVIVLRYKECSLSLKSVLLTCDDSIAHTMTALIKIKLCLYRWPARIPDSFAVFNIEISSAHVDRHVVVTVTSYSSQSCVLIEGIASCCVGDKWEEFLCAKIVYPWIWRSWIADDIFLFHVIKMTKFHQ